MTSPFIHVRGTQLQAGDSPETHRQKLARITLDSMVQFVGLLDAQGHVLEINQVALDGVGIQLAEVMGQPFWTTFWWAVPAEGAMLKAYIERAAQGEFMRWDAQIYGRAGGRETIIIDASLMPVKDTEGRVVFITAEGRDITEKKAQEREIANKNEALQALLLRIEELDEIKNQFFANVSHELRTPLALILGPAERLLDPARLISAEERLAAAQVIARNARLLLKHVNDLLDMSKLEAGKLRIELQDTDVAALLRFTASHFELLAESRRIRFELAAPAQLDAAVDPAKFQRVLMNLLSNAFKFTPDGGHIRCTLAPQADGRLAVWVDDSGPGVPPALRQAVFERFRQGEGGADRRFGGTGLGLAIAKEFAELHGGGISIGEADLGGASFKVSLPHQPVADPTAATTAPVPSAADAATRYAPAASPLPPEFIQGFIDELHPGAPLALALPLHNNSPQAGGRPHVLVVEDHPDMNRFIAESLSAKYRVSTAFDGRQGLAQAHALQPDLIVSDIMMPHMSGAEMIAELRRDPQLSQIPVLLLSAKADEDLKHHLLANGAQDFIAKPFSEADLSVRVANLIAARRATMDALLVGRDLQKERELREHFVSALAHDLRTPLHAARLSAEVLVRSHDPETLAKMSRRVVANIKRADGMLRDLLDANRLRAGQGIPITVRASRLDAIVDAAAQAIHEVHGARLNILNPIGALPGHWDDKSLQRVVENLAANALKYGAGNAPVTVSLAQHGDWAELAVHNHGNPIAPQDHKALFQIYYRPTSALTQNRSGWGVGLTLVKGIVEAHGGTVFVASNEDSGTTFSVRLPLDSREAAEQG